MLCLKCVGQDLRFDVCEVIADGFINVNVVHFEFCERWSGMVKTAQFTQTHIVEENGEKKKERKTYNVMIDDLAGTAAMPNEVKAGDLLISAFGVDPDTGMRITSTIAVVKVKPSGFTDDAETPIPPTPDLYAQLVAEVRAAAPYIGESGNWFVGNNDTGVSATGPAGPEGPQGPIGDKGETGATGPKGDKGDKGETGATGPKGDKGDKGETGADGAQGPQGIPGEDGANGADGYTPQRGVDYWTEADRTQMVSDVLAALPTWEGGAY